MSTNRQALLHHLSALVAFLRRETSGNYSHLMTSPCSLIRQDVDKGSPGRIGNTLCQVMAVEHAIDIQVFHADVLVALCVGLGGLKEKISALALDLEMGLGAIARSLTPSAAALLASAELALLAPQRALARAVIPRIGNALAVGISKEDFQSNIQPNVRMATRVIRFLMGSLLWWFTNDQSIPLSIRPQDEMGCLGRAFNGAVQLDFQEQAHLGGHMQVLPITVQPHVSMLGILAQVDAMPAIGVLEAREATGDALLLEHEIPFERLIQSVRQGLHRRRRHMLTSTPLEGGHQVILEEERAGLGIVRFGGFQHLVVQATRILQARHQVLALSVVEVQAIFKRSHILTLL